MERVLNNFLQKQISYGNLKEDDIEIYYFGLKQSLMFLLHLMTTILIGVVMEEWLEAIVILLVFIPLRTNAGGYHARHRSSCYIFSTLLTILMLWGVKVLGWSTISMLLISIISGFIIWNLSPVEDANKPLCELECRVYRKRARMILLGEIFLMLVLSQIMKNKNIVLSFEVVFLAQSLLLGLGKIKAKFFNDTQAITQ